MFRIVFLTVIISGIAASTEADISCTTPTEDAGKCVSVKGCSNLYSVQQLVRPVPQSLEQYIVDAACELDPTTTGVCCDPGKAFELPENCGLASAERIGDGNHAAVFEFPWMALLMYSKEGSVEIKGECAGALISDRYVITAAHCLAGKTDGQSATQLKYVRLGEHTVSSERDCSNYTDPNGEISGQNCTEPVEDVRYELCIVHPDYRNDFSDDDIGLIRLAERIVFKPHISPICLPMDAELKEKLLPQYIVAGWGFTESLSKSDVLLKAKLSQMDRDECQQKLDPYKEKYNVTISEKQFCAAAVHRIDACAGDFGAPLMWQDNYLNQSRYVLFGVASYGVETCGTIDVPGVYAWVGNYLGWIMAAMRP